LTKTPATSPPGFVDDQELRRRHDRTGDRSVLLLPPRRPSLQLLLRARNREGFLTKPRLRSMRCSRAAERSEE